MLICLDWEEKLRAVHDLYGRDIRIVITGSEADLLTAGLTSAMMGRYAKILLKTFSFFEFKQFRKSQGSELASDGIELLRYITLGGFPNVVHFVSIVVM